MSGPACLATIEEIIDGAGVAPRIEALLPAGVRHRQLKARTLLLGMQLTLADDRPAHLTRVHQALTGLPEPDQVRPGVIEDWETGSHQLTYRQTEYTFGLVADALAKDEPGGAPPALLQAACDALLEASIPARHKQAPRSLAADWTDAETWSRPPRHGTTSCADPAAAWGHRNSNLPGPKGEMFFGYYLVRHEAPVRREALGIEGGARPPRQAVAAAWQELSAVRSGRRRGGREAALTKPGRFGTARRAGSGERDQTVYERNQC